MTSKRLYFLLIGIIGLLFLGLVAGTYGANNLLSTEAGKLTILKAKSAALSQEQLTLNKAKDDLTKYASLEVVAKSVVPQDKDQAEAVREIVNIAAQYGVSLSAISFPASTLGSTAAGTPIPASATPTTKTPSPTTKSSSAGSLSQLQPVKNITGVYQLPITVVGDTNKPVAYDKFISFLSALEHNRRTAQVSTITLEPSTANRNLLSFTLGLNEYIKP